MKENEELNEALELTKSYYRICRKLGYSHSEFIRIMKEAFEFCFENYDYEGSD